MKHVYVFWFQCVIYNLFTDGDWETGHEKYAKYDEVTKKCWPDECVSLILKKNDNIWLTLYII